MARAERRSGGSRSNAARDDRRAAASLVVALLLGCAVPTGPTVTSTGVGGGERIRVQLRSFRELRDEHVVRQQTDYSCGAAALATLLRYGLDVPVSEPEILVELLAHLPRDEEALRKKEGFSLLDLQRVSQTRGYRAQGFRLEPRYLPRIQRPVIVFIRPGGYEHFAVLKGIVDDRVLLADPSLGNTRMAFHRFVDMWSDPEDPERRGIAFAVEPPDGRWPDEPALALPAELPRPEVLSVRELLSVGPRSLAAPRP